MLYRTIKRMIERGQTEGLETLWCWQALALRGLADESGKVYAQLAKEIGRAHV